MTKDNEEAFMAMLRETFPDIFIIIELVKKGHLTTEEVADVVHKMAIVRTSDDGHGKILIEMQSKPEGKWMRIRTIQDKVLRTLPEEELI